MPPNEAGAKALQHIDAALNKKPEMDGPELSAALRCLGVFRNSLVEAQRAAASARGRGQLEHVNAVISTVMAVQYPSGEVPWPELTNARTWLADLLQAI